MTAAQQEWVHATLGDVAQWGSGGTPKAGRSDYYGGAIPWLTSGDLNDLPCAQPSLTITEAGLANSSAKIVEPGSVLIAMYGATIGRVGLTTSPIATNQAVAFARTRPDVVEPRFLFWYLLSERQNLVAAGKGAAQKNISQTILKAWPIQLPSLEQQRKIVAIIETHLSRLDEANSSLDRALGKLKRLDRSSRAKMFQGRYELHSLNDLVAEDRAICYGILMPKEDVPDGVQYVRVKDFPLGTIELPKLRRTAHHIEEKYRRSRLRQNDVLISIRGTFGRVAIVPRELEGGNITQDTARVSPREGVLSEYLAAYLRSEPAQNYFASVARGVAVKGVNIGDLRLMPIPLPPLETQRQIADESERLSSVLSGMASEIDGALHRSDKLRRSLLKAAVTGKMTPSESAAVGRLRPEPQDTFRTREAEMA